MWENLAKKLAEQFWVLFFNHIDDIIDYLVIELKKFIDDGRADEAIANLDSSKKKVMNVAIQSISELE